MAMQKKKISVVTTTRAEYYLLKPLIKQILKDNSLSLKLIVSGTHLLQEFKETYHDIANNFPIDQEIEMEFAKTEVNITIAMAKLQSNFAVALNKIKPDIIVLLGDRYEMLSIATAAFMLKIPIAHIHGGEVTYGAIDDSIRHAITKLSHLHFSATESYRRRIIQLGENPKNVFNVGSLGVENIKKITLLNKDELEKSINFKFGLKNLLITYHPQTISDISVERQLQELLDALEEFNDISYIFTKANGDAGGDTINSMLENFVQKHNKKAVLFNSLGQLRYFSTINYVDGVVGNSSSGIIEVPSFQKPTINIGLRQEGREKASSVIDTDIFKNDIKRAIKKLYDKDFTDNLKNTKNPYSSPSDTSLQIKEILKNTDTKTLFAKKFYDLKGWYE